MLVPVSIPVQVVGEWCPPGVITLEFDAVFRRASGGWCGIQRIPGDKYSVNWLWIQLAGCNSNNLSELYVSLWYCWTYPLVGPPSSALTW